MAALAELGYYSCFEQVYINNYTSTELFGHTAASTEQEKPFKMQRGLISQTLHAFEQTAASASPRVTYKILNLIGEATQDTTFLYDSLFNAHGQTFLNQNNEKVSKKRVNLVWETDSISNISPAVISSSNLVYLGTPITNWQHYVDAVFLTFKDSSLAQYIKLKEELVTCLGCIKVEFDSKPFK